MSTTPVCEDLTASDMFDSLNGFEEMGVVKMFGRPITDFGRKGRAEDPVRLVRALVYVHAKREGANDAMAYKGAMSLPQVELQNYFAPDPADEAEDTDEADEVGDEEGDWAALELEDDDEGKARSAD